MIGHLLEVMDALLGIVEEETGLVRAGKLAEAAKLEAAKAELSRPYLADTARIRASQDSSQQASRPTMAAELRKRHDLFRAVLQMNLTVLATAHAVSESIMRGVSDRARPQGNAAGLWRFGPRGAPPPASPQPLTLRRVL